MTSSPCPFCEIAADERPAHVVYDDRLVLAFLDTHPMTLGHTLVIPRTHRPRLSEVDRAEGAAMWAAAQSVARAAITATGARGTTLLLSDGEIAGQEVQHAHLHVVPRYDSGELTVSVEAWRKPTPQPEALEATAARLAEALA